MSTVDRSRAIIWFSLYASSVCGLTSRWPPEPKVLVMSIPPKGDGIFAEELICQGSFVCQYHGQVLTVEEEESLYPDSYPDYCLRISPCLSIDGEKSGHWSRLINHDENSNLMLHTDEVKVTAYFTALRDIYPGEELCFDYGVAYFIFRRITPAPGTESRSLKVRKDEDYPLDTPPPPPRSPDEIAMLINSNETNEDKKTILMRGLDFYGGVTWLEEEGQVEILTNLNGTTRVCAYSSLDVDELGRILGGLWEESQEKDKKK